MATQRLPVLVVTGLFSLVVAAQFASYASGFIASMACDMPDGTSASSLFDDGMISLRYAHNLSHGEGLVFNPGERVEGYTNFLWVLILTPFTWLLGKSDAVVATQWLGAALCALSGALSAILCAVVTARSPSEPVYWERCFLAVLAAALVLNYYPLSLWSLLGMEVPLLSCIYLGAVLVALRPTSTSSLLGLSSLLSLGVLTRPDSIVLGAVLVGLVAIPLWRAAAAGGGGGGGEIRAALRRRFLLLGGPLLVTIVGHTLFRVGYYGDVLPNTYYLKVSGFPLAARLETGWLFTWPHLAQVWGLAVPALLAVALRRQVELLVLLLPYVATVVYQVFVGGDAWNTWRFLAPTLPLLVVLAVVGARELFAAMLGFLPRIVPAVASTSSVMAALSSLWGIGTANTPFQSDLDRGTYSMARFHCQQVMTATVLSSVLRPSARIAVTWAGTLPYYTGLYTIDLLGKVDPHIARSSPHLEADPETGLPYLPGHAKYDLSHSIVAQLPDYAESLSWRSHDVSNEVDYRKTAVGWFRNGSEAVDWARMTPRPREAIPASTGIVRVVLSESGEEIRRGVFNPIEPLDKLYVYGHVWLSSGMFEGSWIALNVEVQPADTKRVLTLHAGHSEVFDVPAQVQLEGVIDGELKVIATRPGLPITTFDVPSDATRLKLALQAGYRGHVAMRGLTIE